MLGLSDSHQLPPQPGTQLIDCRHHREDDHDNREQMRKVQQVDAVLELLADAARADDAKHGRGAHIEFPDVKRDRSQVGQNVGQQGITDYLKAIGPT